MRTKFEIINLALRHIGMRKIDALDDTDPSAKVCSDFFESCRDDILREHAWPFALVQQPLGQSAVTVPAGWFFAYDYPASNIATAWYVFNQATAIDKENQNFEVMYDPATNKKIIVSNLDAAVVEFTYIVIDTLVWDSKFDMAMSWRLAAEICPSLTGDDEKAMKLMQVYNAYISETKRISASEKNRKPNQTSGYVKSRG